jgi:hypothetical protein
VGLSLSEGLLEETFTQLRTCGGASRECVCYWSGAIDKPAEVDELLHPRHIAHRGFYEVDGAWINGAWVDLARHSRTIRAQIHTHAGEAFHSHLDDSFPLIRTPGFLSLVVPAFAMGRVGLKNAYLVRLTDLGDWEELDPGRTLEVLP